MSQDIRVLVGDDDVNDRYFLEWGFKQICPYVRLDMARTGDDVIRYLQDSSRPKPSLLIIDSMMPHRDGFAVLEWLRTRSEFYQLPVVMLSGQPYDRNEARARDYCVRAYIGKPRDLDELKALVQSWKQKYLEPIKLLPAEPGDARKFQFLVADSSGSFRSFFQKAASEVCPDAGLTFFRDSIEVLQHFEEKLQSTPSLLLLDLGTVSLDVLQWLRRKRHLTELPIIVWTSTPVEVEEELSREFGVTEYLKKPNTFPCLLQTVFEFAQRYSSDDRTPHH